MLSVGQVLDHPEALVVDLRSPQEFAQDHLPGAVNVPLFGDLQRAMVGFLFRQVSPEAAVVQGQRYALGRVRELAQEVGRVCGWAPPETDFEERVQALCAGGLEGMETLLQPCPTDQPPARPVVLHCWRGGLRSRSVIGFLRGIGLDRAVGLSGGYKAYRNQVLEGLQPWAGPKPVVLHGLTGVGKTLVLRAIEAMRPGWTVDLEALAGHRSSILGMVGLEPCSQKTFDSRLFERLRGPIGANLVVEGESRKVGDVVLPPGLWEAMKGGRPLWLHAPVEERVRILLEDYLQHETNREPLRRQLETLSGWLPKDVPWLEWYDSRQEPELVRQLLERYYDPLYRHTFGEQDCLATIDSCDPQKAAREVIDWIESHPPVQGPL